MVKAILIVLLGLSLIGGAVAVSALAARPAAACSGDPC
jgi:hypothetical protein